MTGKTIKEWFNSLPKRSMMAAKAYIISGLSCSHGTFYSIINGDSIPSPFERRAIVDYAKQPIFFGSGRAAILTPYFKDEPENLMISDFLNANNN